MVAALFVETDGIYYGLPGVDPWDEARDARLYAGPHPVVAHPPCNKWSPLAYINQKRIPGYKIGDDGGCFRAALYAVRQFGGVLEHPRGSLAWKAFGLPRPLDVGGGWTTEPEDEGWVCEVAQSAYGHRARKLTWLYYVGLGTPAPLDWRDPETSAIVSGFTHQPKGEHVACEHRRVRPAEASPYAGRVPRRAHQHGPHRYTTGGVRVTSVDPHATSRGHRVKAHFEADIIVEFEDELLDYGSVTQAVQDAIGHTGAVVDDVTEYEETT